MSKAVITESILTDIANAIIAKGGASAALMPTEMAAAIASIGGFLPPSAELVASAEETINLSSGTSYDSWTPTTTNTSILAAGNARAACSYKITTDYQDTALMGFCMIRTDIAYPDDTTYAKGYALTKLMAGIGYYAPTKMPNYSSVYYGNTIVAPYYRQIYHSSASAVDIYASGTYGLGPTGVTWSTSSATSTSSRTVGWTRPIIYARCNSTYFSTKAAAAVDSANTNIVCKYSIYKMDKTECPFYAVFDENAGIFFT